MGKTGGGPERLPAQLSQVNLNAAGIDVGATSHFVAVPQDRAEPPVHEFAAFTADLYRLADCTGVGVLGTNANCPIQSMVRKSYGGIIGDVPMGTIPFGRVATVSDFLRRRADTGCIDVGATSHFVAVPQDRAEPPVRVRRLHGRLVSPGGLAGRERSGDRGHGVDWGVLDSAVRSAGRAGV